MKDLTEISKNFATYLANISPQVKDKSLQWYLSGSLASMTLGEAESICDVLLDNNNCLIGDVERKEINSKQKNKLKTFSRKLGDDVDIVNVNGDLFSGAPIGNKPNIQNVMKNVPNILELMSWNPKISGTGYIDNLESERDIQKHYVSKIETSDGDVYITAPPELLAHKISETLWLGSILQEDKESIKTQYEKDIKDLASMFYGFKDLYEENEFLKRVYSALEEKENSLFSINDNPVFEDAKKSKEYLNKIIKIIASDSSNYLDTICNNKNENTIKEFFEKLVNKRNLDIEKEKMDYSR